MTELCQTPKSSDLIMNGIVTCHNWGLYGICDCCMTHTRAIIWITQTLLTSSPLSSHVVLICTSPRALLWPPDFPLVAIRPLTVTPACPVLVPWLDRCGIHKPSPTWAIVGCISQPVKLWPISICSEVDHRHLWQRDKLHTWYPFYWWILIMSNCPRCRGRFCTRMCHHLYLSLLRARPRYHLQPQGGTQQEQMVGQSTYNIRLRRRRSRPQIFLTECLSSSDLALKKISNFFVFSFPFCSMWRICATNIATVCGHVPGLLTPLKWSHVITVSTFDW